MRIKQRENRKIQIKKGIEKGKLEGEEKSIREKIRVAVKLKLYT